MIRLSVVIPAYNEQMRLPQFLSELIPELNSSFPGAFEIVVVDDGSTDSTVKKANEFIKRCGKVVSLNTNQGKGAAIIRGVSEASGEYICVTDADGSAGLKSFSQAIALIEATGSEGAIGTRYGKSSHAQLNLSAKRKILGTLFAGFASRILGLNYNDTQCGFKVFRNKLAKEIFAKCKISRFGIDFEALYLAQKAGTTFDEIPIMWTEMPGSKVNLLRDGMRMIKEICLVRLMHRHTKINFVKGDQGTSEIKQKSSVLEAS